MELYRVMAIIAESPRGLLWYMGTLSVADMDITSQASCRQMPGAAWRRNEIKKEPSANEPSVRERDPD